MLLIIEISIWASWAAHLVVSDATEPGNVYCARTHNLSSLATEPATINVQYSPDTLSHIHHTITILNTKETFAMRHALPSISTRFPASREIPIFQQNVLSASMGARVVHRTVPILALHALQLDSFSKALVFLFVRIPIFTRGIRYWIPTATSKKTTQTTHALKKIL